MKNLKLEAVLLFASGVAMAQDLNPTDVPSNLINSFNKEYANATDVEWERDTENYKVDFDVDHIDHEVWYNVSGTVVKKEQDIAEASLPKAVRDAISAKYSGYRVDDVEKVCQNNTTSYQVELEKTGEDLHLIFDENGKMAVGKM